jgi:hypothetical protein
VAGRQPDIIEQTIDFWRKRAGREVSSEDARQMVANVSGFFKVLAEWERKARGEDEEAEIVHTGQESRI